MRVRLVLSTCILFVMIGWTRVFSIRFGIMIAVKLPVITA